MQRLGSEVSPKLIKLPANIMVLFSVCLPSFYILGAYIYSINIYRGDWQIIVSFIISIFIIWQKALIVRRSQEI